MACSILCTANHAKAPSLNKGPQFVCACVQCVKQEEQNEPVTHTLCFKQNLQLQKKGGEVTQTYDKYKHVFQHALLAVQQCQDTSLR